MHIAGESLLNDGSAVVFYTVFSGIFLAELDIGLGDDYSAAEAFVEFLRMSLGGTSVGIAYALALIVMLRYLHRRYDHEEIVLQVAASVTVAYLSFYTSEVVCGMSGVIAVVVTGIVTKAFGGGLISDWNVMNSFWSLLEHLLNTLLFALGGIVFGTIISADEYGWTGRVSNKWRCAFSPCWRNRAHAFRTRVLGLGISYPPLYIVKCHSSLPHVRVLPSYIQDRNWKQLEGGAVL